MAKTFGRWTVAVCAAAAMGLSGCGSDSDGAGTNGGKDKKSHGASAKGKDSRGGAGSGQAKTPNGVQKLSATEIVEKSSEALRKMESVRLRTTGVDLRVDRADNCTGTVTAQGDGSPLHLIRKGERIWLKPEDSYWATKRGKAALAKVPEARGKYVSGTESSSLVLGFHSLMCEMNPLEHGFLSKVEKWTKDGMVTFDGKSAVVLRGTSPEGQTGAIYIAVAGKPLPLKLESTGTSKGSGRGKEVTVQFSDYDVPLTVTPPGESIDASKVEGFSGMEPTTQGAVH
ncbi:hypothetical protein [Streptomyces sp. NPDC048639]|uniref:hypothetical protein n=1 Tax=Streptomyces sp. NPDC048639 TaxID=3365581 RepID=UPI00371696CF